MVKKYHHIQIIMTPPNPSLQDLLDETITLLIVKKQMIATAESCTGGLIGHTLTNIAGSSVFYERGVITYSNQSKIDLLGVSKHDLKIYGAVSNQVAQAMAEGIKSRAKVDIGLSTTGIAGPTGGTKEKPIGLVYIGLAGEHETLAQRFQFKGKRMENKQNTLYHALYMLHQYLSEQ